MKLRKYYSPKCRPVWNKTTIEQKLEIGKRYLAGESAYKISKDFNICTSSIYNVLIKKDITRKESSEAHRKYPIKEDFFDKIDTQEKAYFLGILYADGCVYSMKGRNIVNLALVETDKEILIKLNNLLQPTKPLRHIILKSPNRQEQEQLTITNKHIVGQLIKLGCIPNKTFTLIFPEWLDKNLIRHFVRGYFDGDGWVKDVKSLLELKKLNTRMGVDITSTKMFCQSLFNILNEELGINCYLHIRHPERHTTTMSIAISGRIQVLKFLNWIYKDATIYMKRKYQRFLGHLELEKEAQRQSNRICKIDDCGKKYFGFDLCNSHFQKFYHKFYKNSPNEQWSNIQVQS